jgi:hypothetical protein
VKLHVFVIYNVNYVDVIMGHVILHVQKVLLSKVLLLE